MPYPEHVGPDPEQSTKQHFARFRANIAKFLFSGEKSPRPTPIDTADFMMRDPADDLNFDIHYERYRKPQTLVGQSIAPRNVGDVTIVVVPGPKRGRVIRQYFVGQIMPYTDEGYEEDGEVWKDYVRLDEVPASSSGRNAYELAEVDPEVEKMFTSSTVLPAGSELFMLWHNPLEEISMNPNPAHQEMPQQDDASLMDLKERVGRVLYMLGRGRR